MRRPPTGECSSSLEAQRKVRFDKNTTKPPEPPEAPPATEAANATTPSPSPYPSRELLTLSVIFIALYLFIRDGWASLVISNLPPFARPSRSFFHRRHDVPQVILAKIDEAVYRARTPVPLRDYALAADGGMIVDELTSPLNGPYTHSTPALVLDDDTRIGHCWLFSGSQGQIGISTPAFIHPTNVTIEHIPRAIAADIRQAPRKMILWGVVDGLENQWIYKTVGERTRGTLGRNHPPVTRDEYSFVELADFVYDITHSRDVQTFAVRSEYRNIGMDVGLFVLEIVDNWGAESTCVYRVRIHGETGLAVSRSSSI